LRIEPLFTSPERVNQPEIQTLMSRVRCVERYPMAVMGADSAGLNPQSVTIRMNDGKEYFRETPLNAGMPVSPMSDEQLETKYYDCSSLVLGRNEVESSLSMLRNLAALPNVQELMKVVAKTGSIS
jgi:2-methylcitrate dehydratase PrpD